MTKGTRRVAPLLALFSALLLTSCHHADRPHRSAGAPTTSVAGRPVSAGPVYRVVTTVQIAPDGVAVLCGPVQAAAEGLTKFGTGATCGRIHVVGMPKTRFPGSRVVDGYTTTPSLLLAGHWRSGTLTLVRAPKPTTRFWQVQLACAADARPGVHRPDRALARRIADDLDLLRAAGTDVYTIGSCGRWTLVTVPVADAATKALFERRYGPTVTLFGWLRTTP